MSDHEKTRQALSELKKFLEEENVKMVFIAIGFSYLMIILLGAGIYFL